MTVERFALTKLPVKVRAEQVEAVSAVVVLEVDMVTKVRRVAELQTTVVDTVRHSMCRKMICVANPFSLAAGGYGQRTQGKYYKSIRP